MENKSKLFTLGVREAYKFNKNEVAKVLWDTLYSSKSIHHKFETNVFSHEEMAREMLSV